MSLSSLKGKVERSGSLFDPPQVSDLVIQKHQQDFKPDSSIYLKERAVFKYKIQNGNIEEAIEYLQLNFSDFYKSSTKTRAYLDAMKFINHIYKIGQNED